MKMQIHLWLPGLKKVEDTTTESGDRFSLTSDFSGLDLELTFPKAPDGPPAAWNKLREALEELAALASARREGKAS